MAKEDKSNKQEEFIEDISEEVEEHINKLKKKLKKLKKEKQEYLDGWQRERATFANYKKDIQKYIDESRGVVKEESVSQFLNVVDNLELMIKHVPDTIESSDWYKGVGHVAEQARQTMKNMGVEEVEVKEGDEFDPELHEAVEGIEPESDEQYGQIAQVVKKGYTMNGKLIRPAQVVVYDKSGEWQTNKDG